MSRIIIGKAGGKNVGLDLDVLLRTRLLVQANSGGGKSFLLRRLLEQAFGKVQCVVIDPVGEFPSLREKFGYVLVGEGGETPADVRSAALVATKLLELRASAVCDLYSLKPKDRHIWVQRFLEATMNAPKRLWHPVLFVVDEAHKFAPEKGEGESEAKEMMLSLASDGRKYGFCAIFATQRLAKLDKSAAAELVNVLVGPTFMDLDLERAHKVLGIVRAGWKEFDAQMKTVEPGNFWALGRAISTERLLVRIGAVETTHPEAGSSKHAAEPPPPPEKVKALLPKLKDLPQAAEEKARTEADLRKEIRELRGQLRVATAGNTSKVIPQKVVERVADPRAIEAAVKKLDAQRRRELAERDKALAKMKGSVIQAIRLLNSSGSGKLGEIQDVRFELPKVRSGPAAEASRRPVGISRSTREVRSNQPPPDGLTAKQFGILRALAEFEAIGRNEVPRTWIAARSGASHRSSAYTNNLGALRSSGLIEYGANSSVRLSEQGRSLAPQVPAPLSSEEMLESCLKIVSPKQGAILRSLVESYPESLSRADLAERTAQSAASSAYTNNLGALRSAGMIEYGPNSTVKCADWLFID